MEYTTPCTVSRWYLLDVVYSTAFLLNKLKETGTPCSYRLHPGGVQDIRCLSQPTKARLECKVAPSTRKVASLLIIMQEQA